MLVHNGNLTNTRELTDELFHIDRRHLNTNSDTELLVNVLANELQAQVRGTDLDPDQVFDAVTRLHERVEGSYAAIALIAGHGLLAFRDPFGIRPLVLGKRSAGLVGDEWVVASESLVLETAGYELVRDVAPGEAVFVARNGELYSKQCAQDPVLIPCSFEYVYLARPDSIMNGISVYEARLRLGNRLADTIARVHPVGGDRRRHADPRLVASRRDAGRAEARHRVPRGLLQEPLRRPDVHHARPGAAQEQRASRSSTRCREFKGKNVLIIDDSIVRGTTSKEIVHMARDAGANSVTFTSAAPPVRYPHVYGINMPSRHELVA